MSSRAHVPVGSVWELLNPDKDLVCVAVVTELDGGMAYGLILFDRGELNETGQVVGLSHVDRMHREDDNGYLWRRVS